MQENIAILLSTYNGENFLEEQIASLQNQTCKNFQLIIRDDHSQDNTCQILNNIEANFLPSTKNIGVKKSFSTLLEFAINKPHIEYFMFCDQDDVWEVSKIEKTLQRMKKIEKLHPNKPILIHTDLHVTDSSLQSIDSSFWRYENINPSKNSLNKLLMQNTVTGCTMMLNKKLAKLAYPIPNECIMHDWWIALVASVCGKIDYIHESTILYRQHSRNDTGAKRYNLKNIIKKAPTLFDRQSLYTNYLNNNINQAQKFLEVHENNLTTTSYNTLQTLAALKKYNWLEKRVLILRYGLLKNGFFRNLGLFLRV